MKDWPFCMIFTRSVLYQDEIPCFLALAMDLLIINDFSLDNNIDIFVGYTKDSPLSVDTQEDLEKIRKMI